MDSTPGDLLPEERARIKIDKQLMDAGWDIVSRDEYTPIYSLAVKEALMKGNKESDYLLFVDNKAIAVVEAKKEIQAKLLGIFLQYCPRRFYKKLVGSHAYLILFDTVKESAVLIRNMEGVRLKADFKQLYHRIACCTL